MTDSMARRVAFALARPFLAALDKAGFGSKARYEMAYWSWRGYREGQLRNAFYERIFTQDMGLNREFYRGRRILDIGCGPRGSLEWAREAAARVGLDPLTEKYRRFGIGTHQTRYVAAAAEHMPFRDSSFDVVTSVNSLDHVDDLSLALIEMSRVTAPGGHIVVLVDIHDHPTIAEPTAVPWDLAARWSDHFTVRVDRHLEAAPDRRGAVAALRHGLPFDHRNKKQRYGALLIIARRHNAKAED